MAPRRRAASHGVKDNTSTHPPDDGSPVWPSTTARRWGVPRLPDVWGGPRINGSPATCSELCHAWCRHDRAPDQAPALPRHPPGPPRRLPVTDCPMCECRAHQHEPVRNPLATPKPVASTSRSSSCSVRAAGAPLHISQSCRRKARTHRWRRAAPKRVNCR